LIEPSSPTSQKIHHLSRHNSLYSKHSENHSTNLSQQHHYEEGDDPEFLYSFYTYNTNLSL